MIKILGLKKEIKYQQPLIINNLEIEKGYVYTILGHNGSGKSTLLKILYNIDKYEHGEIDIDNKGFSQEIAQEYIAYNPQKTCFLRGTLKENFDYIYKYSQSKNLLDKQELCKLIKEFKLESKLNTDVRKLSGGEQAKAQFIRTLIEPMASLDFEMRDLVEQKIKELKFKYKTVILVTHDFIQAKRLSEKVIFMENLNLIGVYEPKEFFKKVF